MIESSDYYDAVEHPQHYNFGRVETIDYIEDCLGARGLIDYCLGNAMKYVSRAKYKGKFCEDLQKAIWYLEHIVETYERDENFKGDLNE